MAIYRANEIKCAAASQMPDPDATSNKPTSVQVQGSSNYLYRAFLKYDLSGIPDEATILSAKMYVYCNFWNDSGGSGTTNIARITSEWDEETVCWNNQPSFVGTYLPANVKPPSVNTWGVWDVTSLVKEWVGVSERYPNYGLYVVNNNEGGYRVNWSFLTHYYDINNSDDGDDSNNLGTYLEIEYETGKDIKYYDIEKSTMTAIANETRRLAGTDVKMTATQIVKFLSKVSV